MKLKYYLALLLLVILLASSDHHFVPEHVPTLPEKIDEPTYSESEWQPPENLGRYFEDYDNRVSDVFQVDPFYYPSVSFWFLIYTQFSSNHIVIHDNANLSIIYKVLDFTSLSKKNISNNVLHILRQKISKEKMGQLKQDFTQLIQNPDSLSPGPQNILRSLQLSGIKIPNKKIEKITFFKSLQKGIRSQTGQANFIKDGIIRSQPYQALIHSFFTHKKLPEELFAIPFLESSFNPKAESRVGASGIWQFMPLIGSYYFPKRNKLFDYRNNISISSIGASFLMQENFMILRSWDLAVTAYNSGTKHLIKTKKRLKSKNVDLKMVIINSDSKNFGFASKNFYSEFLALVYTLAYREELYQDLHKDDRPDIKDPIRFFISKCQFKLEKVLNNKQISDIIFHNHHITDLKTLLPKGLVLTTKSSLPKRIFYELSIKDALGKKPKQWTDKIKNQSCSTR